MQNRSFFFFDVFRFRGSLRDEISRRRIRAPMRAFFIVSLFNDVGRVQDCHSAGALE